MHDRPYVSHALPNEQLPAAVIFAKLLSQLGRVKARKIHEFAWLRRVDGIMEWRELVFIETSVCANF